MPVRTKPSSEYKKRFRWIDSVKSSTFTPSKEQQAPQAGLSSVDFADTNAVTREPALQRRRKPLSPDNKLTCTTKQYLIKDDSNDSNIGKATRKPGTALTKTFVKQPKSRQMIQKDEKTEKNKAIAAKTKSVLKSKESPPAPTKTMKEPTITRTKAIAMSGGDASKSDGKGPAEMDEALQYRAGIRARPGRARYSSEYQRQFAWKQPSKETPLMAADQMFNNSNSNMAQHVPDKACRSEYQRQFKQQMSMPSTKEQLLQNAQQEVKARYVVKTKSKRGKKPGASDKLHPAGVSTVTPHDDPRLIKSTQNPQKPFFPHATTRKWRSEYGSNFKPPQVFGYENGVWKGADPAHMQPRDDTSDSGGQTGSLQRSKSVGDLPNWYAEVLELRERAKEYQKRSRGTHFSREHLAQLLASQARMWEETEGTSSPQSAHSENKDEQEMCQSEPATVGPIIIESQTRKGSPVRRQLAWPSDSSSHDRPGQQPYDADDRRDHRAPRQRSTSTSSLASSASLCSVSSQSSEIETIEENGRITTPTLREEQEKLAKTRHHLARTTPAKGGALLTSPPSRKRAVKEVQQSSVLNPDQAQMNEMRLRGHNYMAKSAPARAVIPGGISKGFEYDSEDENEDDDTIDDHDRTLTHETMTPQTNAQHGKMMRYNPTSPLAGRKTSDPHPINEELSSPGFQRHSERFFEPNVDIPTRTRTAPRQDLRTAPAGKGPLERPHSGSIGGRPQTAIPQTRKQASSLQQQRVNSFLSPRFHGGIALAPDSSDDLGVSPLRSPGLRRDSDELSLSTISNASSSTLASEVLERAQKRRDDFWGKEKTE